MTYTPTLGATLTNYRTTHVLTFTGGSYSVSYSLSASELSRPQREDFDNLTVAIGNTSYVLHGSIESLYPFRSAVRGEVRITSNGALVARVYGDAIGVLRTEVLFPLASF
jgi:hypothetical protein